MTVTPRQVLEFWFSPRVRPLWFNSTEAFDQELRERFLITYEATANGALDGWATGPQGALALVICLDQFPLNMFRGLPTAFVTEAAALAVASDAIDHGWDKQLEPEGLIFLYMPFMHSENLADQDRAVALYKAAGMQENLRYAIHHRDIVQRYGRFPHRNAILGRPSNPEELDYLASEGAFHG
jgi:uncharacterized protein (DUF924 family)